jgi:hypothetical protein
MDTRILGVAAVGAWVTACNFAAAQSSTPPKQANTQCFNVMAPSSGGPVGLLAILVDRCTGQTWWLAPETGTNGPIGKFSWVPIGLQKDR